MQPEHFGTAQKQSAFLAAFVVTGTISAACRAAEVGRTSFYRWLQEDTEFVTAWEEAQLAAAESLEAEAIRRARDGVEEVVFFRDREIGVRRKYSDTLMIFLLKGFMPEKYGDKPAIVVKGLMTPEEADAVARRYGLDDDTLPRTQPEVSGDAD